MARSDRRAGPWPPPFGGRGAGIGVGDYLTIVKCSELARERAPAALTATIVTV